MSRSVYRLYLAAGVVAFLLLAPPAPASAQIEVEVDPIASSLEGLSLHLARVLGPVRMNVGIFGIRAPSSSTATRDGRTPLHVDGAGFERSALSVFPTIHVGWRF